MPWAVKHDPFIEVFTHDLWFGREQPWPSEATAHETLVEVVALQGVTAVWRYVKLFSVQAPAAVVVARFHLVRAFDRGFERQLNGDDFADMKAASEILEADG
jgi:hypothetical protein